MRPVEKWNIGQQSPNGENIAQTYNPYGRALLLLLDNLDNYCSYCEVFSSDLEVEHVVSQDQNPDLSTQWTNFLLACGRCNGRDNKTNKLVDLDALYLPHLHNTSLAFEYAQGGLVRVNPALSEAQKAKAESTINLLGLDKYPGNPKYPASSKYPQGFPPGDRRWEHRRTAWELATQKLVDYEAGELDATRIASFAHQRGFFSIWFTVFSQHLPVKLALIQTFMGTSQVCFDEQGNPLARNPHSTIDTL